MKVDTPILCLVILLSAQIGYSSALSTSESSTAPTGTGTPGELDTASAGPTHSNVATDGGGNTNGPASPVSGVTVTVDLDTTTQLHTNGTTQAPSSLHPWVVPGILLSLLGVILITLAVVTILLDRRKHKVKDTQPPAAPPADEAAPRDLEKGSGVSVKRSRVRRRSGGPGSEVRLADGSRCGHAHYDQTELGRKVSSNGDYLPPPQVERPGPPEGAAETARVTVGLTKV